MKTSSPAFAVLAAAVVLTPSPGAGQQIPASLSLDEAVARFVETSPELRAARSRLRAQVAETRQSRAAANPTFTFTNEDVGAYSERYFNVNQPVDFLWAGGPRSERADARAEAARAAFRADSAQAVFALKTTFLDAWQGGEEVEAFREALTVVGEVVEDAAERVDAGDLAVYDLRRLTVGRAMLERQLRAAELELADAERRLGALVVVDGSLPRVRAEAPGLPGETPGLDPSEAALAGSPELARAHSVARALEAEVSLARRSWLSGTSLTGGFKDQSDGRSGLYLGVHVPLPLLDRKGAAVDAARAGAERGRAEIDAVRLRIAREAALAGARLQAALEQRTAADEDRLVGANELLVTARVAYAEGEAGVVEFVDAAEAFLEARSLDVQVTRAIWDARFELEHVMGGFPDGSPTGAER